MEAPKIIRMQRAAINGRPVRREREPRMERVIEMKRREEAYSGRAWINGRPLGEVDPRCSHLYVTHD